MKNASGLHPTKKFKRTLVPCHFTFFVSQAIPSSFSSNGVKLQWQKSEMPSYFFSFFLVFVPVADCTLPAAAAP
jgi:hypothetical protein